jgi:hypothetical protein
LVDLLLDVSLGQIPNPVPVTLEHDHFAVVEIDDRASMLEDGRCIGGNEVLAFADADEER